ncbi:hypothetical protein ERJ75_000182100 [Trypanosoma vivax]|uniref:Uncharacterized protein n=1 Tax=Trypanosoma vivax (strain Y486) TaxID=1055687 RepID=F9WRS0_TRYVY|nr:hypothetical protein ERJ75_000182100 [Trypanosoma vivax]CCD20254.1 hypothetical protein, conserved in T.vivax [Trypanosoma vivax Y486]|eukprot:CCD20254.1 hypothetical protein, conserved in T.vivax [Trypanosoma vivax Y486]
MSVYINSAFALLALLPWKTCATAADSLVLGPQATVFLDNCSCSDGGYQLPQPDGFTVNCTALREGLTLKGCGGNTGASPGKCLAVGSKEKNKVLTGCNFSEDALKNRGQCGMPPCTLRLSEGSNGDCGGRKIKLASSNCGGGGGGALCCGSISGENRTNEPQQQFGQHGNSSNSSASPHKVESTLKASPGSGSAASKTNGDSSHSTPRGPESSEHDGTGEKLGASNTTTTPRKNDVQNEGAELGAMKVVVKCAAASLFISSALF